MAKKQLTLSKLDITILGNRVLSVHRAKNKLEIAKDNIIFTQFMSAIDEVTLMEKNRVKEIVSLANKKDCVIQQQQDIIYIGENKDLAEIKIEEVEKGILEINKKYNDLNSKKIEISLEIESFTYLKDSFNSAIDILCENDEKTAEFNKTADGKKLKIIQLTRKMKESVGRIDQALEDAKKIN